MHLCFAKRFLKCTGAHWPFSYISLLILLLLLTLSSLSEGCWGISAPKYGNTSADYDLLVGNTLTVKCVLNNNLVKLKRDSPEEVFVNSSYLIFTHNSLNISSDQIHIIDDLTAELRIPNATVENSGFYGCHLLTPGLPPQLVCGTSVNVGDWPKPVTNFRCINMYNENLTCMWDVENNKVHTDYVLSKSFINEYYTPTKCPKETSKPTSCQWNNVTDPPLNARIEKILNFTVVGTNKLGKITQNFSVNHYEIVLPNKPQHLTIVWINESNITLKWKPPQKLENSTRELPLQYQLWVKTLVEDPEEKRVIDVGVNTLTYTIIDLIPNLLYNISLRCRSNFSTSENMWSPVISINGRTLPDVPYLVPDTVPEAFELRHYDECRSVTLYWKPIPEKYFNGEDFKYVIQQYQISSEVVEQTIRVTSLHITFECLQKNSSYVFKLYSSNEHGLSNNSVNFAVAEHEKTPPAVQDVTAISRDAGHYQLSWKFDSNYNFNALHYKVFWCSSFKPWLLRCDGAIQWSNDSVENSMTLNLPDDATNFQFAVAVTTDIASSGMHWATCIVPFGKALGKLTSVKIEPKTSTSIKVIWNLDCPAQKAVVNRIEIMYCKSVENQCLEKVRVNVTKSNDTHVLHHLEPDSRYCVVIRAYNLKGQASEDSEFFCEKTLEGAPSDSPQNIVVLPKSNATLYVTWRPPLKLNGKVTHYHIYCNNTVVTVNATTGIYEFIGLSHYTYYSIRLDACVKNECSPKSEAVTVRTDVGVPGAMDSPTVEVNSTFVKISWKRPLEANGPISFYQLRWEQHKKSNVTPADKIFGEKIEKGYSTLLKLNCSETEGESFYTFMIRAVNEQELYGPFSAAAKIKACFISQGTTMLVGLAIGGTFAFTVAVCLLYYLVKWMSEKIHQVKNITVMLPKGLEAPETNPLNNYENFQNGLLQQTAVSKRTEQLSPSADDSDSKNRHGSGSSQFSNSSTDELLYKNGRCTKFERKSSGESSGCSSTSSNTTRMHLSSDSGVESDFPPPSPDVVFIDQNGHSTHKPPLPIVMEAQGLDSQDSEFTEKKEQVITNKHQRVKDSNLADGIMLKIDQSYSKFGVNGSVCAPPTWMNALAFYSCHLANSEPSVVGIEYESVGKECGKGMPYSKFGLAKSSGSIMEIANMNPENGYSKFGMLHNLEGLHHKPNGRTNCTVLCAPDIALPTVSMLVMAEEPIVRGLNSKEHCSTIQKLVQKPEFMDGRKSHFGSNGFYQRDPILSNGSDYVSLDQVVKTAIPNDISTVGIESQNHVNMETAYTKLGVLSSSIPDHKEYYLSEDPDLGNPGYVSLNEVQSIIRDESNCPLEANDKSVESFIPLDEDENLEDKEDNCRSTGCDFPVSLPPSTMVENGSHYPLPVNGNVCHTGQLSCDSLELSPTTDHLGTYNKEKFSTEFASLDYTNTTSPEILGTQDVILQEAKCKNLPLSSEDLPFDDSSSLPFDDNSDIIADYETFPLKSVDVLCATDEASVNVSDTESLNGYDTDLPPLLEPPYQTPISSTCDFFPHNSVVLKEQPMRTPEADDTLKPEIIYSGSPNVNNSCLVTKHNNYIPFGALSSSVNNMCKSVPNAPEETKSTIGCLDNDLRTLPLDINLKDHIPHSAHLVPSQNKFSDLPQPTHVSNGCAPRYKVTPTSKIIKNFEPNVKDCRDSNSCPEAHRLSKGTKGNGSLDYFVQLVPTVESTICEV